MKIFDTHVHYDDAKFDEDREDLLKKIYDFGVKKYVNVGCDIDTSKKSIELANTHNFIYASCGIHPSEIKEENIEQIKEIEKLAQNDKVVAIGEIGLDYHWDKENKELQKEVFLKQIDIANKLKLPIIIHTREAIQDTINILKKCKLKSGGILHCCPFNKDLVETGLETGLYIAFGGTCTFKNSKNASEIIELVPIEKMLVETDSPYLAPEPKRGTRNDSRNLEFIINKIAEVKNIPSEEVANITFENAIKIFQIKE